MSYIRKFIFNNRPIRGALVVLDDVWGVISKQKEYPDGVGQFLGELIVTNILLTTVLKLEGKIVIQIQDNPNLDLAVSECDNQFNVRATASVSSALHQDHQVSYVDCVTTGAIVVSIDSKQDGEFYQSIVVLTEDELSTSFEEYMQKSEQLNSSIILAYSSKKVIGFMLQQLPIFEEEVLQEVLGVFKVASKIDKHKLIHMESFENLLNDTFIEEEIVLLDQQPVRFSCNCNKDKVVNMLRSLGREEVNQILEQEGEIKVTCGFCNKVQVYSQKDLDLIFCKFLDSNYP